MSVQSIVERDAFYIGGTWRPPAGDRRFDVVNATTEELIGQAPEAGEADVDAAVAAARAAFDGEWRGSTPAERAAASAPASRRRGLVRCAAGARDGD